MKNIAIIDDNRGARSSVRNILEFNFKDVFTIKEANGVQDGRNLIMEFNPEIVLLDIEMADGSGLDLLDFFTEVPFNLIFITAHKEYALKAIKHRPYEYILKPVNPFDLIKIINTLISNTSKKTQRSKDKIAIKNHDSTILLEIENIVRCEAAGAYTKIITLDEEYLASKNLKHFEGLLNESGFLRTHSAHMVNINYIKAFNRHLQQGILLKNGDKIPVSSRKTKIISEFI